MREFLSTGLLLALTGTIYNARAGDHWLVLFLCVTVAYAVKLVLYNGEESK